MGPDAAGADGPGGVGSLTRRMSAGCASVPGARPARADVVGEAGSLACRASAARAAGARSAAGSVLRSRSAERAEAGGATLASADVPGKPEPARSAAGVDGVPGPDARSAPGVAPSGAGSAARRGSARRVAAVRSVAGTARRGRSPSVDGASATGFDGVVAAMPRAVSVGARDASVRRSSSGERRSHRSAGAAVGVVRPDASVGVAGGATGQPSVVVPGAPSRSRWSAASGGTARRWSRRSVLPGSDCRGAAGRVAGSAERAIVSGRAPVGRAPGAGRRGVDGRAGPSAASPPGRLGAVGRWRVAAPSAGAGRAASDHSAATSAGRRSRATRGGAVVGATAGSAAGAVGAPGARVRAPSSAAKPLVPVAVRTPVVCPSPVGSTGVRVLAATVGDAGSAAGSAARETVARSPEAAEVDAGACWPRTGVVGSSVRLAPSRPADVGGAGAGVAASEAVPTTGGEVPTRPGSNPPVPPGSAVSVARRTVESPRPPSPAELGPAAAARRAVESARPP